MITPSKQRYATVGDLRRLLRRYDDGHALVLAAEECRPLRMAIAATSQLCQERRRRRDSGHHMPRCCGTCRNYAAPGECTLIMAQGIALPLPPGAFHEAAHEHCPHYAPAT